MLEFMKTWAAYAILSHRWGNREPTIQDVTATNKNAWGSSGPSFQKLEAFCRAAADCGLTFAWSDTCCIDKQSSLELDESIRSIYRWYSKAEGCIFHLAQTSSLQDLRDDEWFIPGWTLQELLAPRKLKFYLKGWPSDQRIPMG